MKKICSLLLVFVMLLSLAAAVPVSAGNSVQLTLNAIGLDKLNAGLLNITCQNGSTYMLTDSCSVSLPVGEKIEVRCKAQSNGLSLSALYLETGSSLTQLKRANINNTFSLAVPNSDSTLHAVFSKNNQFPITYIDKADSLTIQGVSEQKTGVAFAQAGSAVTISAKNNQPVSVTMKNALTKEVYSNNAEFVMPEFPLVLEANPCTALTFRDGGEILSGALKENLLLCGETAIVQSNSPADFLLLYANNALIEAVPADNEGAFSFSVPYSYAELEAAFSENTLVELSDEADFIAFAERVNNGETNLNARLLSDISLSTLVSIKNYDGIFDGNMHTISGNPMPLFSENNGAVIHLYTSSERTNSVTFEAFDLNYVRQGSNSDSGEFRFVVHKSEIPLPSADDSTMAGLPVRGTFQTADKTVEMNTQILRTEDRGNDVVLVIADVPGVRASDYTDSTKGTYSFSLKVYPYESVIAIAGIADKNNGLIFKCGNKGTIQGSSAAGGIAATNAGVIRYCYNTGEISAPQAGGIAAASTGSILFCHSSDTLSESIVYTGKKNVQNCYAIGQLDAELITEKSFRNGTVAHLLNKEAEIFGQDLAYDSAPDFLNESNKVYMSKIISGEEERTVFTNESADAYHLYLSEYQDDRMTDLLDARTAQTVSLSAHNVPDGNDMCDLAVTINCNNPNFENKKCLMIRKTNIAPLAEPFFIAPIKFDYTYIVLTPDHFKNHLGNWTYTNNTTGGFASHLLQGENSTKPSPNTPAIKEIVIPEDGFYRIFSYSRSYANGAGQRFFDVQIGNFSEQTLGTHGTDGWDWQSSDYTPMFAGRYDLKLIDSSGYYARMGMLVITDDPYFETKNTQEFYTSLNNMQYKDSDYADFVPPSITDTNRPNTEVAVKLNNQYLKFNKPFILKDNVLLAPYDAYLSAIGFSSSYDSESGYITTSSNGKTLNMYVNSSSISLNDRYTKMTGMPQIINGTVYIPALSVTEILGGIYKWDEDTKTAVIYATVPEQTYWFRPSSFSDLGTWRYIDSEDGAFDETILQGLNNTTPDSAKPAVAYFTVETPNTYWVWSRAKDYLASHTGRRTYNVRINDEMVEYKFGEHGSDGFRWMKSPVKVQLKKGLNKLELVDTSCFYARCDSVLLTTSDTFTPTNSLTSMETYCAPQDAYQNDFHNFPLYTKELNTPTDSVTIENKTTKVVFYKANTSQGQIIQNEIYSLAPNGEFVCTNTRDEELGYLVAKADKASYTVSQDQYRYTTSYTDQNGSKCAYQGLNPYLAGSAEWYVPTDYEVLDNNTIKLLFNSGNAELSVEWKIEPDCSAPLVTAKVTAKEPGYYTLAGWEGGKLHYEDFSHAVAPFRVMGKHLYKHPATLTEQFLFTPMGCYTLEENNKYSSYPITKGVVAESDWVPLRWVYKDNGILGMNMIVNGGGYKGSIFSPVMGSEESNLNKGDSWTMQYRVISSVSDWFDNYKFILQDLYGVDDYRVNTFASLNDAIFNTRKLMKDDKYGGWDNISKGHYNMEGMNTVSEANPMQALQDYLLTEDAELLENRVIPTIASFLTRPSLHFNRVGVSGGCDYWPVLTEPEKIGTPKTGYNINVTAGMYEMTHGMLPYLYDLGLQKGTSKVANEYGSVAPFSNNLNLYLYTGEQHYLDEAIQQADEYLKNVVYAPNETMPAWISFIYISYYPNLASLLDIYEVTKDKKYLDAAEYVGQQMLTGLWVPGVDNDKKTQQIEVNSLDTFRPHSGSEYASGLWWAGDKQFRIGRENGLHDLSGNAAMDAKHGYVDSWIPSRVGLGLEQASTFIGSSSNIIMQYWAGDFVRLSAYTGEKAFENAARNAIIGRFGNYSGYYQTGYITMQQYPEYPYIGPDYTSIYWHHIPPFLAMLESFLINEASAWSNGNITFPALRQQGYAYFNSNQYGHKPGTFYDEKDMWLWLDEGMVDTGNLQIDWIGARKDGVFGLALMNESAENITTTVSLLDKIPGAATYSGKATLYNKFGKSGTASFTNGKCTITIPAKSLVAVKLDLPQVKAPAYAESDYVLDGNADLGTTVATHTNGKAYALQVTPENYYAYVYITDKSANVKKLTMEYTIGNETKTIETTDYPFEFIIKVDNPNKRFQYKLTATNVKDETVNRGSGIITSQTRYKKTEGGTISVAEDTAEYTGSHGSFTPFKLNPSRYGTDSQGAFRLVVPKTNVLIENTANNSITGLTVKGTFTNDSGQKLPMESVVLSTEDRGSDWIIVIAETPEITVKQFSECKGSRAFDLTLYPNS